MNMFEQIALRLKNTPAFPQDYHPSITMEEVGRRFCTDFYDHLQFTKNDPVSKDLLLDTPFTHKELWHKITTIANINKNDKILVCQRIEGAVFLKQQGFLNVSLLVCTDNPETLNQKYKTVLEILEIQLFITTKTTLEQFMTGAPKFDYVIGNPPFTDGRINGGKSLYPAFYKLALQLSDTVAMIMPTTDKNMKEQAHNLLLSQTACQITHIPKNEFDNVDIPMWIVHSSKNASKIGKEMFLSCTTANNNPINWGRGNIDMTKYKQHLESLSLQFCKDTFTVSPICNSIPLFYKFNPETRQMVVVNTPEHTVKISKHTSGFLVLLPQRFEDNGWNNSHVVDCSTSKFAVANNLYTAHFNTTQEVEQFFKFIQSKWFINEVITNVRYGKQRQINTTGLRNLHFSLDQVESCANQ